MMEHARPSIPVISPLSNTAANFEMSPTLPDNHDVDISPSERDELISHSSDNDYLPSTSNSKHDPWRALRIKLYICVFIANISFQIILPAHTRIYEQIFCQQYFQQHDPSQIPSSGVIPEDQCKNPSIQSEVATLRSWYSMFDAAPALIMSIPCGIIIDIMGRRPLLLAGLVTCTVQQFWIAFICSLGGSVPLQVIWFAPLLNFISGGMVVLNMIFVCVICDITSKESLAASLFRLSAVAEFTKVLGPFISGALMQFNPWWAIFVGLAGLLLLIAVSWTVPETLSKPDPEDLDSNLHDSTVPPQSRVRTILSHIKSGFASLGIVWSSPQLIILVLLSPFTAFAVTITDILQQYISLRYNWTLANAAFLFSLQGIAATFSLFLLLPLFTKWLTKRLSKSEPTTAATNPTDPTSLTLPTPTHLNHITSLISLFIITLSFVLQALAPTPTLLFAALAIETLGMGCASALQALAASLVETKDNGRVFSVLTVAAVLSTVVAHPLTAQLFSIGLDKGGGVWLGMPFFVAAGGCAVACGVLGCVRFDRVGKGADNGDDEGGRIRL